MGSTSGIRLSIIVSDVKLKLGWGGHTFLEAIFARFLTEFWRFWGRLRALSSISLTSIFLLFDFASYARFVPLSSLELLLLHMVAGFLKATKALTFIKFMQSLSDPLLDILALLQIELFSADQLYRRSSAFL